MPQVRHINRSGISLSCFGDAADRTSFNPSPPLDIYMATSAYWRVKSWNYSYSLSLTAPSGTDTYSISDSATVLQGTTRQLTTFPSGPPLLIETVNNPADERALVCGPTSWGAEYVLRLGLGAEFEGFVKLSILLFASFNFLYKEDSATDKNNPFKADYYPFFELTAGSEFRYQTLVTRGGSYPAGAFSITTSDGTASQNLYWTPVGGEIPESVSCNISLEAASYWEYKD